MEKRRRGRARMSVPLFPAPPAAASGIVTPPRRLINAPDLGRTRTRDNWRASRHAASSRTKYPRLSPIADQQEEFQGRLHRRRHWRHNRVGHFVKPKIGQDKAATRVTAELKVKMTERRGGSFDDDADVVCAYVTPMSFDSRTISEDISISVKDNNIIVINNEDTVLRELARGTRSTGVQTIIGDGGPYRLKVLPTLRDIDDSTENANKTSRICWHLRLLGRLALCQFGLAWLLTFWAMAGAAAFYATEGPREREQVLELKDMQRDLAVGLATELRQLRANEMEMEPLWSNKVRQYVAKHEKLLLAAVSSGYGEGGEGGQLWTFPGCILFAISLLTTLGFGAPVPRTTPGRTVAVVFAAIGIPAHFLLVLNLGLLLAMKLQRYAIRRRYRIDNATRTMEKPLEISETPPKWVKIVPLCFIGCYYLIGILCFGAARSRPFAASLLFPLDFTAAGGLATTSGLVRITYGIYLEGAVTIAAVAVAIMRVSASQSLTNIGLKYGLLTEA